MKKQAMSALIVLVILGSILTGCAAPTAPTADRVDPDEGTIGIDPDEGTIGTAFAITGSGFGDTEPTIRVGEAKCTVFEWSDREIRAVLADALAAGTYDITIELGEKDTAPITVQEAFTVMPPSMDPLAPMDVATLDKLTIKGSFFGSVAGSISVEDPEGRETNCQLLEWSMESITFVVPEGLFGIHDLIVQNDVGTATQTRVLDITLADHPYIGAGPLPAKTRDYYVQEHRIPNGVATVPSASIAGDIKEFTTTAYWAKPKGDGFWVPKNRRGSGDEPWFITFKVTYNPENKL